MLAIIQVYRRLELIYQMISEFIFILYIRFETKEKRQERRMLTTQIRTVRK